MTSSYRTLLCKECDMVIVGDKKCWGYCRPTDNRVLLVYGDLKNCPECGKELEEEHPAQESLF